jgi:hypothetical protein
MLCKSVNGKSQANVFHYLKVSEMKTNFLFLYFFY